VNDTVIGILKRLAHGYLSIEAAAALLEPALVTVVVPSWCQHCGERTPASTAAEVVEKQIG
jgi:hypothetical protein